MEVNTGRVTADVPEVETSLVRPAVTSGRIDADTSNPVAGRQPTRRFLRANEFGP